MLGKIVILIAVIVRHILAHPFRFSKGRILVRQFNLCCYKGRIVAKEHINLPDQSGLGGRNAIAYLLDLRLPAHRSKDNLGIGNRDRVLKFMAHRPNGMILERKVCGLAGNAHPDGFPAPRRHIALPIANATFWRMP